MKNQNKHEFWVTNISTQRDVMLADLRLTVRRGESRNLLDSKHYSYTLEELQKSAKSGSIKKKSNVIKVRDVPPRAIIQPGLYLSKQGRLVEKLRNNVEVVVPDYEELNIIAEKEIQEKFAEDEAEIIHDDMQPVLGVDKKYATKEKDE